jgi:acyl carrier protein
MSLSRTEAFEGVCAALRDTFPACDLEVGEATSNVDVAGWDSVSQALLIMRIEEVFEVFLPMEEAFQARTVELLVDAVLRASVAA